MKPSPQDLAALCRDLRAAGVPVDVRHELRLREVFGRAGPVSGERARRLVQAVVLADPADRPEVADVLDGWLPSVADTTPPPTPVLTAAPVPGGTPPTGTSPPAPGPPWDKVLGGLLAVVALVGVAWLAIPNDDPLPPPPADLGAPDAGDMAVPDGEVPGPTGSYATPKVSVEPGRDLDWSPWFLFGIGLLGLLAVGPQARRWRAFPQALPPADGDPPAPPPRPPLSPALASWTDPADRRAMVWGVDHFETEDPSTRLDLRGSIRATARAALRPVVRYRRRRQPRTVWLWVDGLADPQAHEVAQQVLADLRRANLDARLAWTFGSPERVTLADHDQAELPSDALDTPPEGAIVVWFTDGQGLSHVDDAAERRRAVRALRAWPRLAIVRCGGAEGGDLAAHARASGAVVLTPDRVAAWIGRGVDPRRPEVDLTLWRAAAALSPTPVDEATLLSLGARLGYPTPRAFLDGVLADAVAVGPRVTWPATLRARWLTWLGQQPELPDLLAFWLAHHAAPSDDDGRTARARAVDRALLILWRDPEQASWALAEDPEQADRVRAALQALTPKDGQPEAPQTTARLPWTWARVSPEARVRLSSLGLAGVPSGLRPVRPGRQWFGLGLSAALVVLGLGLGVAQWFTAPALAPREVGERPAGAVLVQGSDGWAVGLRQGHGQVTAPGPSERLVVDWRGPRAACVEAFGEGEVWRCLDGAPAAPPADARWPDQLLVAISAPPSDPAARRLARRILRWGAADLVVLRQWPWFDAQKDSKGVAQIGWDRFLRQPQGAERVQTVVVQPKTCEGLQSATVAVPNCVAGDFDRLAAAIGPAVRPLSTVWPGRAAEGAVFRGVAEGTGVGADAAEPMGRLRVRVTGADGLKALPRISVDGRVVGRGVDFAVDVAPGQHRVTAEVGDRRLATETVVVEGETTVVALSMSQGGESADAIYFDYDSVAIRSDQKLKLGVAAARMAKDKALRLVLEGHTDERGTAEMNLPKGDRMAQAVKKFLVLQGVDGQRISTRSYGEQRPADKGHSEAAWARNRRVELVFERVERPEGQRTGQDTAPDALAECSPAAAAKVKALVVPVGTVEVCFGDGGPGPRPDVRCDFDFALSRKAITVTPRKGGRPSAEHCQCIADSALQKAPPAGLGPCTGEFKVRWSMPAADRQPAPAVKAPVWLDGKQIRFKGTVEYEPNKARLKAASRKTLGQIAQFLKDRPDLQLVEVANHTDDRGRDTFGRSLTTDRARAVVQALVQAGVPGARLKAAGYGSHRPVAPNTTAAGRAKNRRTELTVLKRKGVGTLEASP